MSCDINGKHQFLNMLHIICSEILKNLRNIVKPDENLVMLLKNILFKYRTYPEVKSQQQTMTRAK